MQTDSSVWLQPNYTDLVSDRPTNSSNDVSYEVLFHAKTSSLSSSRSALCCGEQQERNYRDWFSQSLREGKGPFKDFGM